MQSSMHGSVGNDTKHATCSIVSLSCLAAQSAVCLPALSAAMQDLLSLSPPPLEDLLVLSHVRQAQQNMSLAILGPPQWG